jgi:hypothetical protein
MMLSVSEDFAGAIKYSFFKTTNLRAGGLFIYGVPETCLIWDGPLITDHDHVQGSSFLLAHPTFRKRLKILCILLAWCTTK